MLEVISSMEETKAGKGMSNAWGQWDAVLNSFDREAFTKKGIFQQWFKGGEGVDHVGFWGKNFSGRISASEQPLKQECVSGHDRLGKEGW